jgi:glucose-1-phosphate adenylyltransferase
MPNVTVGRRAKLKNVVVDRGVNILECMRIGHKPELDAARFRRTDNGVCLVTQEMVDRIE